MSSQPPPPPGPSQAGRFKPRKAPAKKKITPGAASRQGPGSSIAAGRAGRGTGGRAIGVRAPTGRDGRGRGRDGRGRGRRGGRARGRGRFVAPKGKVFFTGAAMSTAAAPQQEGASAKAAAAVNDEAANVGVILMPGMGTADGGAGGTEGEEILVGEFEEGSGVGDGRTGKTKLEIASEKRNNQQFSMFDEEEEPELDQSAYTYDSDSSADGELKRMAQNRGDKGKGRKGRRNEIILQPQQLPLPPPRHLGSQNWKIAYDSQKLDDSEETAPEDVGTEEGTPIEPPFLNLSISTPDQENEEGKAWMIFKLPTRLPRLDPSSILTETKNDGGDGEEDNNENDAMPDALQSSTPGSGEGSGPSPGGEKGVSSTGYDDTLKDAAAGRYGKIVVHQSGKAFLIVGGTDSKTPPVRMRLSEGLPCAFLQQAVSIDPNMSTYIPLGEVQKTLVATPDVEDAFPI